MEKTNKGKIYKQEEERYLFVEVANISEKEKKQFMEKITLFIKKRIGSDFMIFIIGIGILILLLIGILINYLKTKNGI